MSYYDSYLGLGEVRVAIIPNYLIGTTMFGESLTREIFPLPGHSFYLGELNRAVVVVQ